MKLAIRKEPAVGGFIYSLFPLEMGSEPQAQAFGMNGYVIIEVEKENGLKLMSEARASLSHQIEISSLAQDAERSKK